jgi:hypothetical protein
MLLALLNYKLDSRQRLIKETKTTVAAAAIGSLSLSLSHTHTKTTVAVAAIGSLSLSHTHTHTKTTVAVAAIGSRSTSSRTAEAKKASLSFETLATYSP